MLHIQLSVGEVRIVFEGNFTTELRDHQIYKESNIVTLQRKEGELILNNLTSEHTYCLNLPKCHCAQLSSHCQVGNTMEHFVHEGSNQLPI